MSARLAGILDDDRLWLAVLAAVSALTTAVLLFFGRGLTFVLDEWYWLGVRLAPGGPSLLEPHNEHLSVLPLLLDAALLEVFGTDGNLPFRIVLLALNLAIGWLVFLLARSRVGTAAAVGLAALVLLSGLAWESHLWTGLISQTLSMAFGLGALLLLDREADRRTDAAAAALLLAGLASSGLGVPFLLAAGLEILLRDDRGARIWIPFAAGIPFTVWFLVYGTRRSHDLGIVQSLDWALDAASAGAAALIGARNQGWVLLLLLVAAGTFGLTRLSGNRRARLIALLCYIGAFYLLTAMSRADVAHPASSRYLTVAVVMWVLVLAEVGGSMRLPRWTGVAVLLVGAFSVFNGHLDGWRDGRARMTRSIDAAGGTFTAASLLGPQRVADTTPVGSDVVPGLDFGAYSRIREKWADPAFDAERLKGSPVAALAADRALVRLGGIRLRAAGQRPGAVCAKSGADLPVPSGGLLVTAPSGAEVTVRIRRFAASVQADAPTLKVPPGQTRLLAPTEDRMADVPYLAALEPGADACAPG